jgi:hypothetical protein
MKKLVYPIYSSWIGEIAKAFMDHVTMVFCLAIGLVVVRGSHLKLNLKLLHELVTEVQGESAFSVRDNREGVSINSEYLVQKNLGNLLSIDILGNRK